MSEESPAQSLLTHARQLRRTKEDYRSAFLKTKEGKRVLLDILQATGVLRPCYVPGNPMETARNEALREFGLAIIDQLDMRGFEGIIELEQRGVELIKIGEEI